MGLQHTSNEDSNKQSTDDAVIEYLSKKGVVEQTEKLALTRISSKLQISPEQLDQSINRLSAKNLIRKIYQQGKVGFELTPKGKAAIEALARAETARVTQRLQEAIQEERKAKLRLSAINRFKAIEEKWQDYHIPDKAKMGEIEQEVKRARAAAEEIERKQPLCQKDPENYDQSFLQYKTQVEKLIAQCSTLSRAVNNYAQIKDYSLAISADVESVNRAISKYESLPEATDQVIQLKVALINLRGVKSQLEGFDRNQLQRLEELKTGLTSSYRRLEILKKPTHEFMPTKRESSNEKVTLYLDPEGPVKYTRKTSGAPLVEKCIKCGNIRRSTSVDIG